LSPTKFTKKAKSALNYYVYALIDPRDGKIFYVGKASANNRVFDHLKASEEETKKTEKIAQIRNSKEEPKIEILRHGLKTEEIALEVEAAIIDTLGLENLTNIVRGHRIKGGRLPVHEIERLYGSMPVRRSAIKESYMMIFINQSYSPTLSEQALYDCVRQFWYQVAADKREPTKSGKLPYPFALSIVDSTVIRVYSIEAWFPAGATMSSRNDDEIADKRWEFVGQRIPHHKLEGKQIVDDNGKPLPANQIGYGYIN
jgi:hypothetical protein